MSLPKEIEYCKLWMEQSKLFWSRLQTAAAIQTGVFAGWYGLMREKESALATLSVPIALFGLALLILLLLIMRKDSEYMESMALAAALDFPAAKNRNRHGRFCGFGIVIACIWSSVLLLGVSIMEIYFLR